jgi:hypothetical protein
MICHMYTLKTGWLIAGVLCAGVSISSQAACRLTQSIVGQQLPNLPLYQQTLPPFPFSSEMLLGQ